MLPPHVNISCACRLQSKQQQQEWPGALAYRSSSIILYKKRDRLLYVPAQGSINMIKETAMSDLLEQPTATNPAAHGVDPIILQIVEGTLGSVEAEVEAAIERTSRSPMIRDQHDYRAGIHDRDR